MATIPPALGPPKVGPQRTSRVVQKLKLLPGATAQSQSPPGSSSVTAVDGSTASGAGLARSAAPQSAPPASASLQLPKFYTSNHPERLTKADRFKLPRVTAFATAGSYRLRDIARHLFRHHDPVVFEDCVYARYAYRNNRHHHATNTGISTSTSAADAADVLTTEQEIIRLGPDGNPVRIGVSTVAEVFAFDYGVVVLWGFSRDEERQFLRDLHHYELEKFADDDVQMEEFNYYITRDYDPRIYNDFIALRDVNNYMVKLAISHAIAQSVKISLFETVVDDTIENTKAIPMQMAYQGKILGDRNSVMRQIGDLFILRININLHGSIIDSPELMWANPQLEPLYQATRAYLEINHRVQILNQRLEVISDLLQMLKEQVSHVHEEYLEFIVIVLIAVEILVAIINIVVDLAAESK
ncbi:hypothetical protein V1514DRAFT_335266 [Lipomyces japonicus]|uniref:uncharacterized protein n=1 Tax=Lipomyces japonicus TaxID=56871 RepID=UPI0034CD2068